MEAEVGGQRIAGQAEHELATARRTQQRLARFLADFVKTNFTSYPPYCVGNQVISSRRNSSSQYHNITILHGGNRRHDGVVVVVSV